jgi:hypothetical protein
MELELEVDVVEVFLVPTDIIIVQTTVAAALGIRLGQMMSNREKKKSDLCCSDGFLIAPGPSF